MRLWILATAAAALAIPRVREVPSPARGESNVPVLARSEKVTCLAWAEKRPSGSWALMVARRAEDERWLPPAVVTTGFNLFVNAADPPALLAAPDGTVAIAWQEKRPAEVAALFVARSTNGGVAFSAPIPLTTDANPGERGFISLAPEGKNGFRAFWLDGSRAADAEAEPATSLLSAVWNGAFGPTEVLDSRVCDCCRTSAATTKEGAFVLYRDRSAEEVREIAVARAGKGPAKAGRAISSDQWKIFGCPVNGPSVDSLGDAVVASWFSGGEDPRVEAAFSHDGGETFGTPFRVDPGHPTGRVDSRWISKHSVALVWTESSPTTTEVVSVTIREDGSRGTPLRIATARSRSSPRLISQKRSILVATVGTGGAPHVELHEVSTEPE